jgi:hypothetical protein
MSCSRYCLRQFCANSLQQVHPYQRNDDLAVRMCLEVVGVLQALTEDSVVVNFAVDGQRDTLVIVDEWLSARV